MAEDPQDDLVAALDPITKFFSPGNSPGIAHFDDFVLSEDAFGNLLIEIAGSIPVVEYDVLDINGQAIFDEGNVYFAFINGYQPPAGAESIYEFLQATGSCIPI